MFTKWDHRFYGNGAARFDVGELLSGGRKVGAVIVKDKRVMTTGYNGAPAGVSTVERGECLRKKLGIPFRHGMRCATRYTRAERHHSGGQAGREHRRLDALLHPSAVHPSAQR